MNKSIESKDKRPTVSEIYWLNGIFLILTPLVSLIGVPLHLSIKGFSWANLILCAFFFAATGLSITGGYHRLFSHKSYEANPLIKFFFLIFGAAAFQKSAIKWCSDHRDHHRYVDQLKDPYSIQKGFFFAHIGWVFLKDRENSFENVRDLREEPLVCWQQRHYFAIAGFMGFLMPFLLGLIYHDPWGGLLWGGFVRTVLVHHSTFLINSLSHYMGKQPYSLKNSSRDNVLTALLTFGEGYHNYHHQFQYDYRNGVRWYQWDPTKWMIKSLEAIRFVKKLRKASDESVFKARILVQREKLLQNMDKFSITLPVSLEQKLNQAQEKLLAAGVRWNRMKVEYKAVKNSIFNRQIEILNKLREDLESSRAQLKEAYTAWNNLILEFYRVYGNASALASY
ncbi:MAG: fatty acid desaturase [Nitrospirae bacterium]|nr:fatty acid desaturase [Nitrospirota bacterium]